MGWVKVNQSLYQYTEVCFASFLSGGFITAIVVNLPERKLAKRTSVRCFVTKIVLTYYEKKKCVSVQDLTAI